MGLVRQVVCFIQSESITIVFLTQHVGNQTISDARQLCGLLAGQRHVNGSPQDYIYSDSKEKAGEGEGEGAHKGNRTEEEQGGLNISMTLSPAVL